MHVSSDELCEITKFYARYRVLVKRACIIPLSVVNQATWPILYWIFVEYYKMCCDVTGHLWLSDLPPIWAIV
jgi:hypothetical protein